MNGYSTIGNLPSRVNTDSWNADINALLGVISNNITALNKNALATYQYTTDEFLDGQGYSTSLTPSIQIRNFIRIPGGSLTTSYTVSSKPFFLPNADNTSAGTNTNGFKTFYVLVTDNGTSNRKKFCSLMLSNVSDWGSVTYPRSLNFSNPFTYRGFSNTISISQPSLIISAPPTTFISRSWQITDSGYTASDAGAWLLGCSFAATKNTVNNTYKLLFTTNGFLRQASVFESY